MTKPNLQTLYVLQNEFGLIKIGRSVHLNRRLRALERQEECAIQIVAALPECGHLEEPTHIALAEHAIEGEWFDGSDVTRTAIAAALPDVKTWIWPYAHDPLRAQQWLESFLGRRDAKAEVRLFRRILDAHLRPVKPGAWADVAVHQLMTLFDTGELPNAMVAREGEETVAVFWETGSQKRRRVPTYSTDLALAASLWPKEIAPLGCDQSALENCIAAMELRLEALRAQAREGTI